MNENVLLAPYTTMKTGGPARYFFPIRNDDELVEGARFAEDQGLPIFVLGGGSNIVVRDAGFDGVVLKMEMRGVSFADARPPRVTGRAGEVWDEVVRASTERGLWGLENLSAIPGTVGATPVQNIGAYGVEAGDVIESVRAYDTQARTFVSLSRDACAFGYRTSVFKQFPRRFIVTDVTYALTPDAAPKFSYHDLAVHFAATAAHTPGDVRAAIVQIRSKKLPDPAIIPNTGSFFKNPVVARKDYESLIVHYPHIAGRPAEGGVKLSAAQLIEICGWKGVRHGDAGVSENHALVIVNHDEARAHEIIALAEEIARDVQEKTNVMLLREVEIV